MIKRSFLGLVKPKLRYNLAPDPVQDLPIPNTVTLMLKETQNGGGAAALKVGDAVKTGQRLASSPDSAEYVISSVTGTVSAIATYVDAFGRKFTAITIQASSQDDWDDGFKRSQLLIRP